MTDEHDGAGQAPDGGTQARIETDQTRAEAAREKQAGEKIDERLAAAPAEPEQYELEDGDKLEMVQHGKVLAVAICRADPPDPELRLAPLYAALAKAQGAFPEIPKNRIATVRMKKGGQFSFKYSDLSDLIKATRPALSANGLAVFQVPSDELKECITTLAHSSGLVLIGHYPIKHGTGEDRLNPGQDWAISWAYARRYGLSGLLGIAAEETVEGDQSGKTSPDFEAASGDGVLSVRGVVVPEGATKAEKAVIFAKGIEDQMLAATTLVGLTGVGKRNREVSDALQDHFPALYDNIIEAYEQAKAAIGED